MRLRGEREVVHQLLRLSASPRETALVAATPRCASVVTLVARFGAIDNHRDTERFSTNG